MMQPAIRTCGWCFLLLWMGWGNRLPAQALSPCEIDLALLQTTLDTGVDDARPGAVFYLVPPSLFSPGASPERQAAGGDAPVLYQPNKYFQGDFAPLETVPRLILPLGLSPLDLPAHQDLPFVLLEKNEDYLLFECQGKKIAAYADSARLARIFHREAARKALAEKRTYAQSLRGLEVRIVYETGAPPRFAEVELASCYVARDHVVFSYWAEEAGYLYVDAESRIRMYEKSCLMQQHAVAPDTAAGLSEEAQKQLDAIVKEKNPVKQMQENPVLMALLMAQFEIAKDSYAGIDWYLHKDLVPERISRTSFVRANLNSNGILYLQSNYFSPAGLGHTQVEVSIGTEKTRSNAVPVADARNIRVESEAGIEEQIHFTKDDGRDVIHFIAYHVEKPITLTFLGEAGQSESILMTDTQKRAIRDAYVLYLLIGKGE